MTTSFILRTIIIAHCYLPAQCSLLEGRGINNRSKITYDRFVIFFGRPFVKRFALCYRSVVCLSVCLSVLSVCDVRALWPNGWTDQDETWQAGRPRPCHIVLDGDPAPPPPKGHSPPNFGPYLLRPNGCMDQDVTWYGARPRPMRLCVKWGPRSPSQKGGGAKFSAHVYCGQTAG